MICFQLPLNLKPAGKRDVEIGMLPVMLRSNLCALSGKTEEVTLMHTAEPILTE
jgi:hypothetical protein